MTLKSLWNLSLLIGTTWKPFYMKNRRADGITLACIHTHTHTHTLTHSRYLYWKCSDKTSVILCSYPHSSAANSNILTWMKVSVLSQDNIILQAAYKMSCQHQTHTHTHTHTHTEWDNFTITACLSEKQGENSVCKSR